MRPLVSLNIRKRKYADDDDDDEVEAVLQVDIDEEGVGSLVRRQIVQKEKSPPENVLRGLCVYGVYPRVSREPPSGLSLFDRASACSA